jgi:uncharacterized RDD family membrane protein YckC
MTDPSAPPTASTDPERAPAPAGAPVPDGPSGPRAGFWRRVGATIVDALVLAIPLAILFAIFDRAAAQALGTLLSYAYVVYFEGSPSGQTLGKRALGIRVIDFRTGGPIGYGRALVRAIVEIFSGLVVFLGYLWMLWDGEKQTWHDKAANSVVVPVDAYPVRR